MFAKVDRDAHAIYVLFEVSRYHSIKTAIDIDEPIVYEEFNRRTGSSKRIEVPAKQAPDEKIMYFMLDRLRQQGHLPRKS